MKITGEGYVSPKGEAAQSFVEMELKFTVDDNSAFVILGESTPVFQDPNKEGWQGSRAENYIKFSATEAGKLATYILETLKFYKI